MAHPDRLALTLRATWALAATAILVLAAAAAAQSPTPAGPEPPTGPLAVTDAWVRVQPMPGIPGAAYLTIANTGAIDDALVAVTTPAAGTVEMHQTTTDTSGQMQMTPVDAIPVPAGSSVALAPGGYHLMLIDLVAPLGEGDEVPIALVFRGGASVAVMALVRAAPPLPMGSMAPMATRAPMAPMDSPEPSMGAMGGIVATDPAG